MLNQNKVLILNSLSFYPFSANKTNRSWLFCVAYVVLHSNTQALNTKPRLKFEISRLASYVCCLKYQFPISDS